MYYGNRAKVYIPGWWEIRKMCKGLERLKPQVSVMLEYVGSFDGVPKGKRYLDLICKRRQTACVCTSRLLEKMT